MKNKTQIKIPPCLYKYRTIQGKTLGWFQAEREDVEKMFKNKTFRENLMWLKIDEGEEDSYLMWAYGKWFIADKKPIEMENPF